MSRHHMHLGNGPVTFAVKDQWVAADWDEGVGLFSANKQRMNHAKPTAMLPVPDDAVYMLAWADHLYGLTLDGLLIAWDVAKRKIIMRHELDVQDPPEIVAHPDGGVLLSIDTPELIHITLDKKTVLGTHNDDIASVLGVCELGVLCVDYDNVVQVCANGEFIPLFELDEDCTEISLHDNHLLMAYEEQELGILKVGEDQEMETRIEWPETIVSCLNYDYHNKWVLAGSDSGEIAAWDLNGNPVFELETFEQEVVEICVDSTGEWLFASAENELLRMSMDDVKK